MPELDGRVPDAPNPGKRRDNALRITGTKGRLKRELEYQDGDVGSRRDLRPGDVRMIVGLEHRLQRSGAWIRHLGNCALLFVFLAGTPGFVTAQTPATARSATPSGAASTLGVTPKLQNIRLSYIVTGADEPVIRQLKSAISRRLRSVGVDITNRFPTATLILYVMQDVNSNVNKSGVTIAMAYVSNAWTDEYALGVIKQRGTITSPVLKAMLQQKGFLMRLNTAHLDKASVGSINLLADITVTELLRKVGVKHVRLVPSNQGVPWKVVPR